MIRFRDAIHRSVGLLALLAGLRMTHPALAAEDDHQARLSLYAAAAVGSEIAAERCDGVKRNMETLNGLKYYAGIFAVDKEPLSKEMERLHLEIERQYGMLGKKGWCEAVWKAFGPDGEMVSDLLTRPKPPDLRK